MSGGLRVLLVEDSKVLTERLTEAIRQIPDVELIGTADTEAAALAAVKRDAIDVIILDLHLKQGTGFGVMRALAIESVEAAHHRAHQLRSARVQERGHRARRDALSRQGAGLRAPARSAARDLRVARLEALTIARREIARLPAPPRRRAPTRRKAIAENPGNVYLGVCKFYIRRARAPASGRLIRGIDRAFVGMALAIAEVRAALEPRGERR